MEKQTCDCIQEAKDVAIKYAIDKNKIDKEQINDVYLQGELMLFSGGNQLSSEATVEYSYIAKTSGKKRNKKEKVYVNFKYCPFCGREY